MATHGVATFAVMPYLNIRRSLRIAMDAFVTAMSYAMCSSLSWAVAWLRGL
jgi:hypothetical protein